MVVPVVAAAAAPALAGGGAAAAGGGAAATATATSGSGASLAANGGGILNFTGKAPTDAFASSVGKGPSGASAPEQGPEVQGPSVNSQDPWVQMGHDLAGSVGHGKSFMGDMKTAFGGKDLNQSPGFGGPAKGGPDITQGGPMAMLNPMKPGGR